MIEHIQEKIKTLEYELKAIDYTNNSNNLTLHDYEEKRRLEIICKIQVLNEVIMSYK
jgi:hypothetical protein